jgi:threonine aldolase
MIDLRSDTVTQPTLQMREAMANAKVGDDVYQEDPTVNLLQKKAASMMGKEAGLFVSSGTMANLIAVLAFCQRGEEVIMGNLGHTFLFEAGGVSALGGVVIHTLPNQNDGTIDLGEIRNAFRTRDIHHPISRLLILENTHNRCGGVAISSEYTQKAAELMHSNQLLLHLDGARIFNASAALKEKPKKLVAPADSISFCLSKGLCAPVGSVLCGREDFIERARRIRKMLGGGMRQAGIIAAAGIVALDTMVERIQEDHLRAYRLARELSSLPGIILEKGLPQTNMVFLTIEKTDSLSAREVSQQLFDKDIRVGLIDENRLRLVTHYWISDKNVDDTIKSFKEIFNNKVRQHH